MSDTLTLYGVFPGNLASKAHDWVNDTDVYGILLTAAYTFNQDTHLTKTDLGAAEVTGAGYTAGGKALTNKTKTYDAPTNKWTYDADDLTWAASTITARQLVIYKNTGTAGTSLLIARVLFNTDVDATNGADRVSTGGPFTEVWNAAGLFAATV